MLLFSVSVFLFPPTSSKQLTSLHFFWRSFSRGNSKPTVHCHSVEDYYWLTKYLITYQCINSYHLCLSLTLYGMISPSAVKNKMWEHPTYGVQQVRDSKYTTVCQILVVSLRYHCLCLLAYLSWLVSKKEVKNRLCKCSVWEVQNALLY